MCPSLWWTSLSFITSSMTTSSAWLCTSFIAAEPRRLWTWLISSSQQRQTLLLSKLFPLVLHETHNKQHIQLLLAVGWLLFCTCRLVFNFHCCLLPLQTPNLFEYVCHCRVRALIFYNMCSSSFRTRQRGISSYNDEPEYTLLFSQWKISNCWGQTLSPQTFVQDAQLLQRDRAAGWVIVFAKSRRLEQGDNILRTLWVYLQPR